MSIRGGPDIIEDGLVLCLDAADRNSYPGTGTTWYDLTNTVGNVTLYNSPTYLGDSFSFDGLNDYASSSSYAFGSNNGITLEIVFKTTSSDTYGTYGRIIDWQDCTMSIGTYNSKQFRCWLYAGGSRHSGEFYVNSNTVGFFDNWHHAVITYNLAKVEGYWDNTLTFSVNKTGNIETGSYPFTIGTGDNYYSGIDLALVRVYNKGLSANDVNQNYNATKGRFGL